MSFQSPFSGRLGAPLTAGTVGGDFISSQRVYSKSVVGGGEHIAVGGGRSPSPKRNASFRNVAFGLKLGINVAKSSVARSQLCNSESPVDCRRDLILAINRDDLDLVRTVLKANKGRCVSNGAFDTPGADNSTPLIEAARRNKTDIINELLCVGANVNAQDRDGWSPLMICVVNENIDAVDLLLRSDCNPNIKRRNGDFALGLALLAESEQIARSLVGYGADINMAMRNGHTSLAYAEIMQHKTSFSRLLQKMKSTHTKKVTTSTSAKASSSTSESSVLIPTHNRSPSRGILSPRNQPLASPLIMEPLSAPLTKDMEVENDNNGEILSPDAASQYLIELVQAQYSGTQLKIAIQKALSCGANPNSLNRLGQSCLMALILNKSFSEAYLQSVRNLIDAGSNINYRDQDGQSILYVTFQRCLRDSDPHIQLLELLLGYDSIDSNMLYGPMGESLLHKAADAGNAAITRLLIHGGIDSNIINRMGQSALHLAVMDSSGTGETTFILCDEGNAIVDILDRQSLTPLHLACMHGRERVASILIEYGADLEAVDRNGCTPLHLASSAGHDHIISLLVDAGADVNATDSHGNSALHAAVRHGWGSATVVSKLVSRGANVHAIDQNGDSPLVCVIKDLSDTNLSSALQEIMLNDKNGDGHNSVTTLDHSTTPQRSPISSNSSSTRLSVTEPDRSMERFDTTDDRAPVPGTPAAYRIRASRLATMARALLSAGANPNCIHAVLDVTAANYTGVIFIEILIGHAADVNEKNSQDPKRRTPLERVIDMLDDPLLTSCHSIGEMTPAARARFGSLRRIVQLLVGNGAVMNIFDRICVVTGGGYLAEEFAKMFIESGADLNAMDALGHTPLMAAVNNITSGTVSLNDVKPFIALLLQNGANVNRSSDFGCRDTVLHQLVKASNKRHKDVERLIEWFITEYGADVNILNDSRVTPLSEALKQGEVSIINILIKHGADVGDTIHTVISKTKCSFEALKLSEPLMKAGADPNVINKQNGTTPILAVIIGICNNTITLSNGIKFIEFLLSSDADPNAVILDTNYSAMHIAVRKGPSTIGINNTLELLDFLVRKCHINIDARDSKGETALFHAVQCQDSKIVGFLCSAGANTNVLSAKQQSAFHRVIAELTSSPPPTKERSVALGEMATELVEHGAETDVIVQGRSPLEAAIKAGDIVLASLLVEYGVSANAKDKKGISLLHRVLSDICILPQPPATRLDFLADIMSLLLSSGGDDTGLVHRLLIEATKSGGSELSTRFLQVLMNSGVEIEVKRENDSASPILAVVIGIKDGAMAKGDGIRLIKWLIEVAGCNVNLSFRDDGLTPLICAALNGSADICECLVSLGAEVNGLQASRETVLKIVCRNAANIGSSLLSPQALNSLITVVNCLIKSGANVNFVADEVGGDGLSVLHECVRGCLWPICEILITSGAMVDVVSAPTAGGRTVLHSVCDIKGSLSEDDMRAVRTVLCTLPNGDTDGMHWGADPNISDVSGLYPLDIALARGHEPIIDLLIHRNADLNLMQTVHVSSTLSIKTTPLFRVLDELVRSTNSSSKDIKVRRLFLASCVNKFIAGGADVNVGESCLGLVFRLQDPDILQQLITVGVNVNATVLPGVATSQDVDHVSALDDCVNLLVKSQGSDLACIYQVMTEAMVEAGANVKGSKTLLSTAIRLPTISLMKLMIGKGVDIDAVNNDNNTVLHELLEEMCRAKSDRRQILEDMIVTLIEAGCSVTLGGSPLFTTLDVKSNRVLMSLLKRGIDVKVTHPTSGVTPLALAMERDMSDVASILLEAGADPNVRLTDGSTPLYRAFKNDDQVLVTNLTKHGADVNVKDSQGRTPFAAIIEELALNPSSTRLESLKAMAEGFVTRGANPDQLPLIIDITGASETGLLFGDFLLSVGGNVDARDEQDRTPLWYAVEAAAAGKVPRINGLAFISMMVKRNADLGARCITRNNNTVLHVAAAQGAEDILSALLNAMTGSGSNTSATADVSGALVRAVSLTNGSNETPLLMACRGGHVKIVALLVKAGADLNFVGGAGVRGMAPIHEAVLRQNVDLVSLLLDGGADPNAIGVWGVSPLLLALGGMSGKGSVCESAALSLIDAGANICHRDTMGRTSLHRAAKFGLSKVITAIIKKNDPSIISLRDIDGYDAAVYAAAKCDGSVVKLLMHSRTDVPVLEMSSCLNNTIASALELYEEYGGMFTINELNRDNSVSFITSVSSEFWGAASMWACYLGVLGESLLLCQIGSSLTDSQNRTLLHWCAYWGEEWASTAALLISSGIHANAVDRYGLTAADIAKHVGNISVASVFKFDSITEDETPLRFNDLQFLPCLASLRGTDKSDLRYRSVSWCRLDNVKLLSSGSSVVMGPLGSPYISSVFSFCTDDVNSIVMDIENEGLYHCRVWQGGVSSIITVDDWIPVIDDINDSGVRHSAFITVSDPRLLLLFKAYAKLMGSFSNLLDGWMGNHSNANFASWTPTHDMLVQSCSNDIITSELVDIAFRNIYSLYSSPMVLCVSNQIENTGSRDCYESLYSASLVMSNLCTGQPNELVKLSPTGSCHPNISIIGGPHGVNRISHRPQLRLNNNSNSDIDVMLRIISTSGDSKSFNCDNLQISIYLCMSKDGHMTQFTYIDFTKAILNNEMIIGVVIPPCITPISCFVVMSTQDSALPSDISFTVGSDSSSLFATILY